MSDTTADANRALVLGIYAAFAARDLPSVLQALSPDVTWAEPDNPLNPAAGTRHGHAGFLEWARAGMEAEEILLLEPRQVIAEGISVAVVGVTRCRARPTGKVYQTDFVHLVTIQDGLVVAFQEFFDTWAAAEAFRAD